jgi:hypothetical protein
MKTINSLEELYQNCCNDNFLAPREEVDVARAESLLELAKEDLKSISELNKTSLKPNTLLKLTYEVLHSLVESFLIFDKVASKNHRCLFAYLCYKHPELDLDWNFFETIRTKRNGLCYYGTKVESGDYKKIYLQAKLYIDLFMTEIKKNLAFQ